MPKLSFLAFLYFLVLINHYYVPLTNHDASLVASCHVLHFHTLTCLFSKLLKSGFGSNNEPFHLIIIFIQIISILCYLLYIYIYIYKSKQISFYIFQKNISFYKIVSVVKLKNYGCV